MKDKIDEKIYRLAITTVWLIFIFGLCALFNSAGPLWLLIMMVSCW